MKTLYLSIPLFSSLLLIWPVRGSLNIGENSETVDFPSEESTETRLQSTVGVSVDDSYWESNTEGVNELHLENNAEESLQEPETVDATQILSRKRLKTAVVVAIIGLVLVFSVYTIHAQKTKQKEYLQKQLYELREKFEATQYQERRYYYQKLESLDKEEFLNFQQRYNHFCKQSASLRRRFDDLKKQVDMEGHLRFDQLSEDLNSFEKEIEHFNSFVRLLLKVQR